MSLEKRREKKRETFEEWMKQDHVLVHVDATKPTVEVPSHVKTDEKLTLKVSYLFQGETVHDEVMISAYLKFGQEYYHCVLPWDAIWGFTSAKGENIVWPEELPKDLLISLAKSRLGELGRKIFGKDKDKTNGIQKEVPQAPQTTDTTKKRNSILKRVK